MSIYLWYSVFGKAMVTDSFILLKPSVQRIIIY